MLASEYRICGGPLKTLLPENVVSGDGTGPAVDLDGVSGKLVVLTLGISRVLEHETLDVSVWGSKDGADWGLRPLVSFPRKFYCGVCSILLNLSSDPAVRYARVQWKMKRWTRPDGNPLFAFFVNAQDSGARLAEYAGVLHAGPQAS